MLAKKETVMDDLAQQREARAARITTVTSENLAQFNNARIKGAAAPVVQDAKPADEAKSDPSKLPPTTDDKNVQDKNNAHQEAKPAAEDDKHDKGPIANRFSKLAEQRKAAEQRAEAAEAKLAELERMAKPVTAAKEKPQAANFKDAFEYAEALADWKVEEKLRARDEAERAELARLQAERVTKTWNANVKKTAGEIADYTEIVAAADFPLTTELRDAILESEIGPRMQYYLAKNPDEVERLTHMTVRGMERAFGKLEAMIEDQMAKVQTKTDEGLPAVKLTKRVQEPPEPMTPIAGAGISGGQSVVDANGNVTGSYADYKAARKAGKIR